MKINKKHKKMKPFITLLLASFFLMQQAWASSNEAQCSLNGIDYKQATQFIARLQKAVQANDKEAVAGLVNFPLRVNKIALSGKILTSQIRTKKEFINQYDLLFSKKVRNNLLQAKPTDVFCNWQGAMITSIWFQTDADADPGFFVINI